MKCKYDTLYGIVNKAWNMPNLAEYTKNANKNDSFVPKRGGYNVIYLRLRNLSFSTMLMFKLRNKPT